METEDDVDDVDDMDDVDDVDDVNAFGKAFQNLSEFRILLMCFWVGLIWQAIIAWSTLWAH